MFRMHKLTKDGFESQKKPNGIYIFASLDCFTCTHHIDEFKKFSNSFYVVPTTEDPEYFINLGINITPTTRLYKNGEIVFEKSGMFFETQFNELRRVLE